MNNITRRLVYPSIVFALGAVASKAESIHAEHVQNSQPVAMSDPLPGFADVNESSFSEGSSPATRYGSFNERNEPVDTSLMATEGEGHGRAPGASSDTAPAPQDPTDQVVSDASAVVSENVDPSDISLATTDMPQTTTSESSSDGITVVSEVGAPEPSSMFLVGSMFLGFAVSRKTRQKRA
jgi:hypothetical protein